MGRESLTIEEQERAKMLHAEGRTFNFGPPEHTTSCLSSLGRRRGDRRARRGGSKWADLG
jgi:hypothetical protein